MHKQVAVDRICVQVIHGAPLWSMECWPRDHPSAPYPPPPPKYNHTVIIIHCFHDVFGLNEMVERNVRIPVL